MLQESKDRLLHELIILGIDSLSKIYYKSVQIGLSIDFNSQVSIGDDESYKFGFSERTRDSKFSFFFIKEPSRREREETLEESRDSYVSSSYWNKRGIPLRIESLFDYSTEVKTALLKGIMDLYSSLSVYHSLISNSSYMKVMKYIEDPKNSRDKRSGESNTEYFFRKNMNEDSTGLIVSLVVLLSLINEESQVRADSINSEEQSLEDSQSDEENSSDENGYEDSSSDFDDSPSDSSDSSDSSSSNSD